MRLGHPAAKVLDFLVKACNLPINLNESSQFCESCQFGKSHALTFPLSNSRAMNRLDLIHIDFWGPAPMLSGDGYRYYILFFDDYSRYTWLYPLKQKK